MAGEVVLRRRLRLTLDFEVTVEGLTEEGVREHYGGERYEELLRGPGMWDKLLKQVRLQSALLEDEAALRRYLTYLVLAEVDPALGTRLWEVFGVSDASAEVEILGPVFERLGEEDAAYYREVFEQGLLREEEALRESISVRMSGGVLEKVVSYTEGSDNP